MADDYIDFDWKSHRETLDDVFFTDEDVIKKKSEQYKDFWQFLERYQQYQRRKRNSEQDKRSIKHGTNSTKRKGSSVLELPETFNKRYKFNISLAAKDARTLKKLLKSKVDYRGTQRDESNSLTVNDLLEFKTIILYYLDFCQKQKFAKLQKLKSDQANLPISQFRDVIVQHVIDHQVVIVAGDTGCGKSTQIPQYLLSAGFSQISCTQPRRIACISLAKRVSYETLNEYGSDVAYQIRFETSKTRHTKILFLTEGLLLRQLSSDPALSQYNIIVMDEVHERHIHGDFLLGVLKGLVQARSDLKLVLMSATINIELFATYFKGAPVIQVPGRLYPIEVRFMPPSTDSAVQPRERLDPRPYLHILQLIDNKYPANERGDLLIFLSGMSEISAVVDAAEEYAQQTQRWIILALHSALSIEEQDKVFDVAPEGVRKCIVSTNIAETSVTIDGVRFIVDSGKVKEMSYDSQTKLQKLEEFWISQASAEQRKGRAGRTGPGVCFRLYAESDYEEFSQYSTPEIHRAPLDSIILQMISLGIPDVRNFPFIEPPLKSSIENSIYVLKQQGALNSNEEITPTGEMLAKLPVDVVIGKMLIMGSVFHMVDPVLTIAAAMSVQSPFTRRFSNDPDVMNSRQLLESEHGDPFTLLNAFDEWLHAKSKGSSSRKWCRRRGLEEQRFYEMVKLKEQFEDLLHDHGLLQHKGHNSRERKRENRDELRKLKREHVKGPRRPKMLKLGQHGIDESDDEGTETDVRDLEFKLIHDLDKLQRSSILRRSFSLRDLNLLKIILCCGLYPQMAIPDEHNVTKNVTEQVFHTTRKQYLMLHPTCVFISQPDLMRPEEKPRTSRDASDDRPKTSRYASDDCRNDHELMSYVSLLETRKPYVMNVMRVPALQTLLLFGRTVDSNADCTRLVVDEWVELGIPDAEHAQKLVSSIIHLRTTWDLLLKRKIERSQETEEDIEYLEYIVSTKLSEFLDSNVNYTIKRLHQTDIQHLFIGNHHYDVTGNCDDDVSGNYGNDLAPFLGITKSMSVHPSKGGIKVNDYFTYNDLRSDVEAEAASHAAQFIQKHWTCGTCGTKMVVTVLERIEHEKQCSAETKNESVVSKEESKHEAEESNLERLKKTFYCSECEKEFKFTATEILRHKRTHR